MCFAPKRFKSAVCAVLVYATLPLGSANAEDTAAISIERRDAARRWFEQGEQAYESGDFAQAAKAFGEAFQIAPHHAPLWNAARAWQRAGEQARAANAYAMYLRISPPDAPDRDEATQALAALAAKLGRLEVYAADVDIVRVDDEVLEGTSIYVHPGMHVIEGRFGASQVRRTELLEAGSVRSVALVPQATEALDVPPQPSISDSAPQPVLPKVATAVRVGNDPVAPNSSKKWVKPVAIVAGSAAIVSGAFVIWSGLDTLSARKEFDAAPTEDKLIAGKNKQFRTNFFLGSMIGTGAIAGSLATWWIWSQSRGNSAVAILPPVAGMPLHVTWTGSF